MGENALKKKLFKVWKYLNIDFRGSSLNGCGVVDFFAIILKRV
jgi:hypothetical protein